MLASYLKIYHHNEDDLSFGFINNKRILPYTIYAWFMVKYWRMKL